MFTRRVLEGDDESARLEARGLVHLDLELEGLDGGAFALCLVRLSCNSRCLRRFCSIKACRCMLLGGAALLLLLSVAAVCRCQPAAANHTLRVPPSLHRRGGAAHQPPADPAGADTWQRHPRRQGRSGPPRLSIALRQHGAAQVGVGRRGWGAGQVCLSVCRRHTFVAQQSGDCQIPLSVSQLRASRRDSLCTTFCRTPWPQVAVAVGCRVSRLPTARQQQPDASQPAAALASGPALPSSRCLPRRRWRGPLAAAAAAALAAVPGRGRRHSCHCRQGTGPPRYCSSAFAACQASSCSACPGARAASIQPGGRRQAGSPGRTRSACRQAGCSRTCVWCCSARQRLFWCGLHASVQPGRRSRVWCSSRPGLWRRFRAGVWCGGGQWHLGSHR